MKPNIECRYSKPFAFFRLAINILFFCVIFYEIRQAGFSSFLIGLLAILSIYTFYFVVRIIVPAINGIIMVEITPDGIIDSLNGRKLQWGNIDSMNYRMG